LVASAVNEIVAASELAPVVARTVSAVSDAVDASDVAALVEFVAALESDVVTVSDESPETEDVPDSMANMKPALDAPVGVIENVRVPVAPEDVICWYAMSIPDVFPEVGDLTCSPSVIAASGVYVDWVVVELFQYANPYSRAFVVVGEIDANVTVLVPTCDDAEPVTSSGADRFTPVTRCTSQHNRPDPDMVADHVDGNPARTDESVTAR
jgi:hypothetical protein